MQAGTYSRSNAVGWLVALWRSITGTRTRPNHQAEKAWENLAHWQSFLDYTGFPENSPHQRAARGSAHTDKRWDQIGVLKATGNSWQFAIPAFGGMASVGGVCVLSLCLQAAIIICKHRRSSPYSKHTSIGCFIRVFFFSPPWLSIACCTKHTQKDKLSMSEMEQQNIGKGNMQRAGETEDTRSIRRIRKAARLCSPATKPCSLSSRHLQFTFQLLDRKMCLSLCGWETGEQEVCLSGYRKADVLCTLKTKQPDELQHLCLGPCNQSNLFVCLCRGKTQGVWGSLFYLI